ncbi:MAG: hypothetical protein WC924_04460 [Candidatus Gracilibacteria bacterium]
MPVHAHTPSSHPNAALGAPGVEPEAVNNTLHFNHGGILGFSESIGRLLKGVTVDAAVDTFGGEAQEAQGPAAVHPTLAAAPAALAAAPATAPTGTTTPTPAEHRRERSERAGDAARVAVEANNLYTAWKKGDIEDKDITGFADAVLDLVNVDWARPFIVPLVWGARHFLGVQENIDDYEMDYGNIGDRVLKLSDTTRKPFLKRIQKDGVGSMENQIGDLLSKERVAEEAGLKPDDLRAQISNLFNVGSGVTTAKLTERARQMKSRLKYEDDPASTASPKAKLSVGNPRLDKVRDAFITRILDRALASLTVNNPDVLAKLYPPAEDAATKFEWTEDKYKDFGASILDEVTDGNRKNALETFDPVKLKRAFRYLYPVNPASLGTTEGRKRVKDQLKTLFNLEEPFKRDDLLREAGAIRILLIGPGTPPPVPSPKESQNLTRLTGLLDLLTTPATAAVVAGPFPDNESVEALFADVTPVSPEDFVRDFRELEEKAEIAAYVRGYRSSTFRGHYPYLVSAKRLDGLIKTGTPEELNLAKKQIIEFSGLTVSIVDAETIADAVRDFKTSYGLVRSDLSSPEDVARYAALEADITAIEACLVEDRLEALFDRDDPYVNFFTQLAKVNDSSRLITFFNRFNWITLMDSFDYMKTPSKIGGTMKAEELKQAKKQLCSLTGVKRDIKPELTEVQDNAAKVEKMLRASMGPQVKKMAPAAYDNMEYMVTTLAKLRDSTNGLTQDHLDKLYP